MITKAITIPEGSSTFIDVVFKDSTGDPIADDAAPLSWLNTNTESGLTINSENNFGHHLIIQSGTKSSASEIIGSVGGDQKIKVTVTVTAGPISDDQSTVTQGPVTPL